jgi:hypothetical protein
VCSPSTGTHRRVPGPASGGHRTCRLVRQKPWPGSIPAPWPEYFQIMTLALLLTECWSRMETTASAARLAGVYVGSCERRRRQRRGVIVRPADPGCARVSACDTSLLGCLKGLIRDGRGCAMRTWAPPESLVWTTAGECVQPAGVNNRPRLYAARNFNDARRSIVDPVERHACLPGRHGGPKTIDKPNRFHWS